VNSRLKKFENLTQALKARLVPQQDLLTQKFRERISGGDGGAALEEADAGKLTGKIAEATVLFRTFAPLPPTRNGLQRRDPELLMP